MNTLFRHFIGRGDDDYKRLSYGAWFISTVPITEFTSDEQLFWKYIEYSDKLGAPLRRKYFELWLHTELRGVLRETNARVPGCEALSYDEPTSFETAIRTTTKIMLDNFTILETAESDIDDFRIDVAVFFTKKKQERLTEALSDTYTKLSDTDDSNIAADYALDAINNINEIYNPDKLDDLDTKLTHEEDDMEFISDSGLQAIDKDSDGLHRTQLFGIEAQPGTGKTRFAAGTYGYRAATLYHHNVLFITLEQTRHEIESLWIARHVFEMFNVQVSDKMIRKGSYPEEVASQVEAAKYDLFDSGKYGKLIAIEETFYNDTFVNRLRNLDRLKGPFDLIIIDYMGLIKSPTGPYKKEQALGDRISMAYELFKAYVRNNRKAGIAIGQFNREGIEAGEADKAITTDMAQGGIAVYRHTDYNIAMSRTAQMKAMQRCRFSQPKVRGSAGFGTFLSDTRLGFCWFKQIVQQTV